MPCSLHQRFPAWIYPSGLSEAGVGGEWGCLPTEKEQEQK